MERVVGGDANSTQVPKGPLLLRDEADQGIQ
jgi:hypothetical protein